MASVSLSPLSGARDLLVKSFTISRTDTTASIKAQLPAGAVPIAFIINGTVSSDAATTATISIGNTTASNQYVNGYSVKSNGASAAILPAIGGIGGVASGASAPRGLPVVIYGKYAETGTASTTGGPWTIDVLYAVL